MEMAYNCPDCKKSFTNEKYLNNHIRDKVCTKKHFCPKCNKEFSSAYNLRVHQKKKTPCISSSASVADPIIKYNCIYCGKTFVNKYTLKRHADTCFMKNNQDQLITIIEKMSLEMTEIKQQLQNGLAPTIINNNNNNTLINNNNNTLINNNMYLNIKICGFGKEDLKELDQNHVMYLLKNHPDDFIPRMIEYIYANPKKPRFHNVFLDLETNIVYALLDDESDKEDTEEVKEEDIKEEKEVKEVKKDKEEDDEEDEETKLKWKTINLETILRIMTDRIRELVRPGSGPYFDLAMQAKDTETANNIINIARHIDWNREEIIKMNMEVLAKIAKNKDFRELVSLG